MAVVVAGAGVAGGDGSVAHLNDTVEAAEVGGVVCGHHDGEGRTFFEEETVDDLAARLIKGRIRLVEQEDFGALDDGAGSSTVSSSKKARPSPS